MARHQIRKIDIIRKIRKSISNVATMPVDVIVYYKDEFSERDLESAKFLTDMYPMPIANSLRS